MPRKWSSSRYPDPRNNVSEQLSLAGSSNSVSNGFEANTHSIPLVGNPSLGWDPLTYTSPFFLNLENMHNVLDSASAKPMKEKEPVQITQQKKPVVTQYSHWADMNLDTLKPDGPSKQSQYKSTLRKDCSKKPNASKSFGKNCPNGQMEGQIERMEQMISERNMNQHKINETVKNIQKTITKTEVTHLQLLVKRNWRIFTLGSERVTQLMADPKIKKMSSIIPKL